MTSRPTLRIGILGAGFLATTRARCYRRVFGVQVELAAVAAARRERAEAFARQHGVARVHADAQALCADPALDVVDLCVPNALHKELCVLAAAAKKHVICTKPLAAYVGQDLPSGASDAQIAGQDRKTMLAVALRDADAMLAATRAAGVQLCYGENWLYAPALTKARALVASSRGRLLEIRGQEAHSGSHSPFARSWRHAGGGALLRLGAHPIGAILALARAQGARVRSVQADVAQPNHALGREVESWGCAILAFDDGTRGIALGGDHLLGGMESWVEIFGSNFHMKCSLSPHDQLRAYAPADGTFAGQYLQEKLDTQAGWSTPMPDEDQSSGHQAMIQSFCEALARGERVLSDGELGRDVVEVVYAAYLAAAEGRRVELPAR